MSLDYFGDTIVNSISDTLLHGGGLPAGEKASGCGRPSRSRLLFELVMALHIRDNLTLNILMLIHPLRGDPAMARRDRRSSDAACTSDILNLPRPHDRLFSP